MVSPIQKRFLLRGNKPHLIGLMRAQGTCKSLKFVSLSLEIFSRPPQLFYSHQCGLSIALYVGRRGKVWLSAILWTGKRQNFIDYSQFVTVLEETRCSFAVWLLKLPHFNDEVMFCMVLLARSSIAINLEHN